MVRRMRFTTQWRTAFRVKSFKTAVTRRKCWGGGGGGGGGGGQVAVGVACFVFWLLIVPATCECISGTDLLRQFYVLPH